MSMNQFETDEQRAEALVDWLKAKGGIIVAGVVLGFSGIAGWHYYRDNQSKSVFAQAKSYTEFYNQLDQDIDHEHMLYQQVQAQENVVYKGLAALNIAKKYEAKEDLAQAQVMLTQALADEMDPVLIALIKVRLAKIQYESNELDAALKTLEGISLQAYKTLVKDLEGDILAKKGETEAARVAYEEAIFQGNGQFTQRKLEHLGRSSN